MIRAITQFHENARLVASAETTAGRCLIWLLSSAILLWHREYGPVQAGGPLLVIVICALLLATFMPARRHLVLSGASLLAVIEYFAFRDLRSWNGAVPEVWATHPLAWLHFAIDVVAVLAALFVFVRALKLLPLLPGPIRRYPVVALHFGIWLALLAEPMFRTPTILHEVLPIIAWRLSYAVQFASRGLMAGTKFTDHFFYLWPVYGPNGVPTPLGKGLASLSRHEAQDSGQLARSQLAGFKLLIVACAWEIASLLIDALAHGDARGTTLHWVGGMTLGLPRLHHMMDGNLTSAPIVIANLYLELISWSLYIAIYGHIIIGCLRLLGFNVFRHSYRPLLSTSIVDFWGRWSYYYKELLTEFFFYPTYLRTSWAGARLRLFLAVFAAAAVGNMYFVVLTEVELLLSGDVTTMWTRWGSRSVYCVLLAIGIWVSMLRQQQVRSRATTLQTGWTRVKSSFLVCTFYAVVHIWNVGQSGLGPMDRLVWLSRVIW